jgi:glutamyl-tRNA synthetase
VVRTRFAPSPTGALHPGNVRVAVLNWLFARQRRGAFLLRIEDTDVERGVEGAEEAIFADLRWLGLDWDEGPSWRGASSAGAHAPYRQSERGASYQAFAERLRDSGHAYACYCTTEEIESRRAAAIAEGRPQLADPCATLAPDEAARLSIEGRLPALRFRVARDTTIVVDDVVRGSVRFDAAEIGDFILLRSDGLPTYNFAVVVDDVLMEITHVIRGVGHLSNTPRQLLLYEALGATPPVFAHVPMVLGPDRQKLSKRHGAQAIAEYAREGYHPDALVNYLSLLSWSSPSGEEVLTREQLIAEVSLDRIGAADAVFDSVKLRWLSARHIERMLLHALVDAVAPFVDGSRTPIAPDLLPLAVDGIRSHLSTFSEIDEHLAAYFPAQEGGGVAPSDAASPHLLETALAALGGVDDWSQPALEAALSAAAASAGVKGRAFYEPLRLALTDRPHGPPFATLLRVQGRERALGALARALRVAAAATGPDGG